MQTNQHSSSTFFACIFMLVATFCTTNAFHVHHNIGTLPTSHHQYMLRGYVTIPTATSSRSLAAVRTTSMRKNGYTLSPIVSCTSKTKHLMKNDDVIETEYDEITFSGKSTLSLVGAQSALVIVAVIAANIIGVPNNGLGDGFTIDSESIKYGILGTVPLFVLAFVLDYVEKEVPALQAVSKATQRSVLALLGGVRIPLIAIGVSMALGAAAGIGEEMLFRGVLQSELGERFGDIIALTSSAVIFGALHAVTPLYAIIASLASLYFGELYLQSHNLAVPIVCHGLYDVGALFAAHLQITAMSPKEREDLENWTPPGSTEVRD